MLNMSLTYVCIGAKRGKKTDSLIWIRWEVHLAQVTDSRSNIGRGLTGPVHIGPYTPLPLLVLVLG